MEMIGGISRFPYCWSTADLWHSFAIVPNRNIENTVLVVSTVDLRWGGSMIIGEIGRGRRQRTSEQTGFRILRFLTSHPALFLHLVPWGILLKKAFVLPTYESNVSLRTVLPGTEGFLRLICQLMFDFTQCISNVDSLRYLR